ncbi:adaptor protein MecA [Fructobacillus ficulneus]|nr:adaptor protein MecA [Fructobacillus ficulneus]
MEMERINDNTIRVMIGNEDLQDRGTSVRDLLSDRDKIESFFYNILAEIDTGQDFVNNDKLSFQVLPNQNGLELFISRVGDEEALSSLLANIVGDDVDDQLNHQESTESIDDVPLDKKMALLSNDEGPNQEQSDDIVAHADFIELASFEQVLSLVDWLDEFDGYNSLYAYQGRYYFLFDSRGMEFTADDYDTFRAKLVEFGRLTKISYDVLEEHGQGLFINQAVKNIKELFFL